jgi:hypothetical protein
VPVAQQKPLAVLIVMVSAFVLFWLLRIYTPRLGSVCVPKEGEKLIFPLHSAHEPKSPDSTRKRTSDI